MSTPKRGFVLYFDACHSISTLPPEQRGYLLSALYDYAVELSAADRDPESALTQYPELGAEARMAFLFMGGAVRRDTRKWKERRELCREKALERFRRPDAPENRAER